MTSKASEKDLGDAILQSVQHGTFPQSEDVASASVPSTALPKLQEVVGKAREDTKSEIRKLSREAASDVDGWIDQARKLQNDIKRSQETAHEIVQQAEAGKDHTAKVQDAASKVSFLYSEIGYNETLSQTVEQLRDISALVDSAQNAAVHGHIIHALERLEDADAALKQLGQFENSMVGGLLKSQGEKMRLAIKETTTESWNGLIVVDLSERRITLKEEIERDAPVHINTVVEALKKLGEFDKFIANLSRDFEKIIVSPRLTSSSDHVVSAININGDDIEISGHVNDLTVKAILEDIQEMAEYLSTRLPPSIAVPLSERAVPFIASRLISNWLVPSVPLSMDGIPDFQETLSLVLGLAEYFDELEWKGQKRLQDWVDRSADIWLARRKEAAIAKVHVLCPRSVREKKHVERIETQTISTSHVAPGDQEEHDEDWGAEWGDEQQEIVKENPTSPAKDIEEEDMSAWGEDFEDEPNEEQPAEPKKEAPSEQQDANEEDADAWGWGDDEDSQPVEPKSPPKAVDQNKANGKVAAPQDNGKHKEVTLRETYTVTAIPDSILEIIMQVVSDVEILNQPELVTSAVAPASGGLYAIPSLLMAMYRATAAAHYSKDIAGNMLIYNDCMRLSDSLNKYLLELADKDNSSTLSSHLRPSKRLKLDKDIKSVESFGKRAYGREMESQRTIIRDLLDGAQGFQTCTAAPFAAECDNAIAMTIDRIEEVKRQWQNVLSHSALLQSLGSLVSTALTKFITEVEDMSDIAEDESKKLHSYCLSLSSLSSLFLTENDAGEPQDMTSIYTPNWFKFQYLGEILDSSLADIKYFWTDGELKLEMEAEEVVDLIKALFAESDHRRKAIGDIRRTSMQ